MEPEVWVGLAAVFVCGGAIGAVGTLLSQWVLRRLTGPTQEPPRPLPERELVLLRSEVADLGRVVQNLDARLEFQEQLLGGGMPTTQAPGRLADASPRALPPLEPPSPEGAEPPD